MLLLSLLIIVVTIEFVSSMYSYGEDHGTVNDIEVRISHEIAQELEVFYFGGQE